MTARISSLFTYPIKGCRGSSASSAIVTPRGLSGDREFIVAVPRRRRGQEGGHTHTMVTQRTHPQMARVVPALASNVLTLKTSCPDLHGVSDRTLELPLDPVPSSISIDNNSSSDQEEAKVVKVRCFQVLEKST